MQEFAILDQQIGFPVANYVCIRILSSIGPNLGQNTSKANSREVVSVLYKKFGLYKRRSND